jgi:hypothetical protein
LEELRTPLWRPKKENIDKKKYFIVSTVVLIGVLITKNLGQDPYL